MTKIERGVCVALGGWGLPSPHVTEQAEKVSYCHPNPGLVSSLSAFASVSSV